LGRHPRTREALAELMALAPLTALAALAAAAAAASGFLTSGRARFLLRGGVKDAREQGFREPTKHTVSSSTGKNKGEAGTHTGHTHGRAPGTTRSITQTNRSTTIPQPTNAPHTHDRTTTETAADNGTSVFGRRENREVH
jgi:hypothetical protein